MSDNPLNFFRERSSPSVTTKSKEWTPPPPPPIDTGDQDWIASLPSQEWLVPGRGSVRFYTIGILAAVLQRDPVTIRSWERKGWIPPAGFRSPAPRAQQIPGKESKGRRLYSESQVRFLHEAYKRFHIADPKTGDWPGFRKHIKNHYPTQP